MAAGAIPAPHRVIGNGLDVFPITWCNRVAGWLAMSRGKWRAGKHTLLRVFGNLFYTVFSPATDDFPEALHTVGMQRPGQLQRDHGP